MKIARNTKSEYVNAYIDELSKDGQRLINEAYNTKTTQNRKYNEHDAYVFGVYYNGNLMKYGFVGGKMAIKEANGWAKAGITPFYGRDVAEDAIHSYKPKLTRGFALVILVTTFYSAINENKGYKIISQAVSDLSSLTRKYKGSSVTIIGKKNV